MKCPKCGQDEMGIRCISDPDDTWEINVLYCYATYNRRPTCGYWVPCDRMGDVPDELAQADGEGE
ncbi:MAG: hypothetical protein GTN69_03460 [Armatimonadetes bacterium]|nr:hypothetical protein [Armatimonadota bacterium]